MELCIFCTPTTYRLSKLPVLGRFSRKYHNYTISQNFKNELLKNYKVAIRQFWFVQSIRSRIRIRNSLHKMLPSSLLKIGFWKPLLINGKYDFVRGVKNNNNNNNPGRGGTGGTWKVKSCKDHDGAQGWELSRPTTYVVGMIIKT